MITRPVTTTATASPRRACNRAGAPRRPGPTAGCTARPVSTAPQSRRTPLHAPLVKGDVDELLPLLSHLGTSSSWVWRVRCAALSVAETVPVAMPSTSPICW